MMLFGDMILYGNTNLFGGTEWNAVGLVAIHINYPQTKRRL